VSRYSDSGSTHRNGTEAMFCVMWLVEASSITDPSTENASHSSTSVRRGRSTAADAGAAAAASVAMTCGAPGCRPAFQAEAAQASTNTA
jgi:hypothetical protein